MSDKKYFVYILTNFTNNVLYTGVTNDLPRRIEEHKSKKIEGFTKRYNVTKLVYAESFGNVKDAIAREKQIKNLSRSKKITLIEQLNPTWQELLPY